VAALALAVLAVLPYVRTFELPFLSDDYLLLDYSRKWGPVSGWVDLFGDVLYRSRATSIILTHWIQQAVGVQAWGYQAASLGLHMMNTWLVALLGAWPRIGWRISIPAAAFFAVHEIHQEAVLWYSAAPELLALLLMTGAFLLTVRGWHWAGLAAYALALVSKESAVVVLPALALALWLEGVSVARVAGRLAPHVALTLLYVGQIFAAGPEHYHLQDGTFEVTAPFWITAAATSGRLLWFWGLAALAVLMAYRREARWDVALGGLGWMVVALLPYSFLTYMHRAPSRHTYLAGLGVALVVGCAWSLAADHWKTRGKRWAAGVAVACILHNSAYVWIWKHPQYVRRTRPTEALAGYARQHEGRFALTCWPYTHMVAESTVRVAAGREESGIEWTARSGLPSVCIDESGSITVQQ
jgi:hypothetical protein